MRVRDMISKRKRRIYIQGKQHEPSVHLDHDAIANYLLIQKAVLYSFYR